MTTIIGVDPGAKRTGMAIVHYTDTEYAALIDHADLEGIPAVWEYLSGVDAALERLVVEDYIPNRVAGNPRGLEVIGAVKAWGHVNGVEVVMQPASGRKVAVPDATLNNLGMNFRGDKDRNAKEAARHVIWYLKKQVHKPTLWEGWGPPHAT